MKINEIFYSLQGEGRWTGTPCVFVRFSGCNLKCSFCDTMHEESKEYTVDDILSEVKQYPTRHIILTGGEPTLQISEELLHRLHDEHFFVHVETNGTNSVPQDVLCGLDWITVSPKGFSLSIQRIDELKVVYQGNRTEQELAMYEVAEIVDGDDMYIQPCDTKDEARNAQLLEETINYIKQHPTWKLSLQTQKILNVR